MPRATVEDVGAETTTPSEATQAAPATASTAPVSARMLRFSLEGQSFSARLHSAPDGDGAVLWVFGSGGGLGGPAGGIYTRLGAALLTRGVTSLELDYRRPGDLGSCLEDVLAGVEHLESLGRRRVVLIGHSFGRAVVINAGIEAPTVIAVCAMSSQTAGTERVGELSPKPVLFMHGEQDEILPHTCSLDLFKRAGDPKELILYPSCQHGLDQCSTALDRDLAAWIGAVLDLPGA